MNRDDMRFLTPEIYILDIGGIQDVQKRVHHVVTVQHVSVKAKKNNHNTY